MARPGKLVPRIREQLRENGQASVLIDPTWRSDDDGYKKAAGRLYAAAREEKVKVQVRRTGEDRLVASVVLSPTEMATQFVSGLGSRVKPGGELRLAETVDLLYRSGLDRDEIRRVMDVFTASLI